MKKVISDGSNAVFFEAPQGFFLSLLAFVWNHHVKWINFRSVWQPFVLGTEVTTVGIQAIFCYN